jgi:hypothetical protein
LLLPPARAGFRAIWLGAISSTGHGKLRAGSRARTRARPEAAILAACRAGTDIEEALQQAIDAGIPPHQERLF